MRNALLLLVRQHDGPRIDVALVDGPQHLLARGIPAEGRVEGVEHLFWLTLYR